jgi:hypothetical protein
LHSEFIKTGIRERLSGVSFPDAQAACSSDRAEGFSEPVMKANCGIEKATREALGGEPTIEF